MKKIATMILTVSFLLVTIGISAQTWSQKRSVEAYAELNPSEPSITIRWSTEAKTSSYSIYRRDLGSSDWGTALASLNASDTAYKDSTVSKYTIYEYAVVRIGTDLEPFSGSGTPMEGYGFIASGIEIAPIHNRGVLLLIVSQYVDNNLQSELGQLMNDLTGDGWNVKYSIAIPEDSVPVIKMRIMDQYNSEEGLGAVYLLGQIAVPYSGMYCSVTGWSVPPDGHGSTDPNSHCGAWPADAYYGTTGGNWTDEMISDIAKRAENNNYIGDGKFDNIDLPDSVHIQIGRVDLSRLSKFSESELDLTRRYIAKSHDYRHVKYVPLRQAIIEDNFSGMQEGFASGGWRDFSAELGPSNIIQADLFTNTRNNDYLLNYVCGAGSYTSCSGLGTTDSFTTANPAVFNHMFGSFFGDFDIANNIGRASLAAPKNGLVTVWSGRPKWVSHTMAIGETIGECAIRSQNNRRNYGLSFFENHIHVALLGDPSLRSAMVAPPENLILSTNIDSTRVFLNWTASSDPQITGYYIYWSEEPLGEYFLLNQTPQSVTSFTHYTPNFGSNYYMVRAEKLEQSASASYYNLSQGALGSIAGILRTASVDAVQLISEFNVYPVPATELLTIRCSNPGIHEGVIYNLQGQKISDVNFRGGSYSLDVQGLSTGVYWLNLDGQNKRFVIVRN